MMCPRTGYWFWQPRKDRMVSIMKSVTNKRKTVMPSPLRLPLALLLIGLSVIAGVTIAERMLIIDKNPISTASAEPEAVPASAIAGVLDSSRYLISDRENFFDEYKMERDRFRSRERELITRIMDDPGVDPEVRKKAQESMLAAIAASRKEFEAENLIKARGYEDAVVFLGEGVASVIVKAPSLDQANARQIGDAVARATGVQLHRISIVEREK